MGNRYMNDPKMLPVGYRQGDINPSGLALCPICGAIPMVRHNLNCHWVICPRCGLSTPAMASRVQMVHLWNKGKLNARPKEDDANGEDTGEQ